MVYHVAGLVAARDEKALSPARQSRRYRQTRGRGRPRAGLRGSSYVSSMAAGGPAARGSPLTGTEPPRPVTAYGRSKLAAEAAVTAGALPG